MYILHCQTKPNSECIGPGRVVDSVGESLVHGLGILHNFCHIEMTTF